MRDIKRELPTLLLAWQDHPPKRAVTESASRAGPTKGSIGAADQGFGGFGDDKHTVGAWVTQMLQTHADVPATTTNSP